MSERGLLLRLQKAAAEWSGRIGFVFVLGGALLATAVVAAPRQSNEGASDDASALEQRVALMVRSMPLEQKVGQMIQAEIQFVTPEEARRYFLGSILNGGGSFPGKRREATVAEWLALAERYYDASLAVDAPVAIPIIWGTDAVHGHNNLRGATLFPHNIGLGAAADPDLVQRIGRATAREVLATGIDWTFAPTVAVAKDARWGRTYESYSDDPKLVARLGEAMVRGLQGELGADGRLSAGHVAATAKHFIGDGATRDGVDQGDVDLTHETLLSEHGTGYLSTIEVGVQTVMASFNSVAGRKVHGDRDLLTGVLKQRWGFDGLVVSDWNGIGQVSGCTNSDCAQAINAGIDMVMAPEDWKALHATMMRQVREGVIPMSRVDDAVARILRVKLRLGLFESGGPTKRAQMLDGAIVGSAEHRALAREAVRKSLVMLKNDGNLLPLRSNQRVLVFGEAAREVSAQAGGWSVTWQGTETTNEDFPGATTLLSALEQAVVPSGGSVSFVPESLVTQAQGDVAVVVFGEQPYAEGEGDLSQLRLREDRHLAVMRELRARGIPVVSVMLTGRPLWVNPELNASTAFVVAWLPGSEGGGVADVLVGDASGRPRYAMTGKLPFSWPKTPLPDAQDTSTTLYPRGFGVSFDDQDAGGPWLREDLEPGQTSQDLVIFDRRARSPWRMFLGDSENWQQPVAGSQQVSDAGHLTLSTVDWRVQGDARRLEWSGRGDAQWYLQVARPIDLRDLHQKDAVLAIDLAVHEPPTRSVELRVDCQYPCGAKADITRLLRAAPRDQWVRLSLDTECFRSSGLALERVDTLPLLRTSGRLGLSIGKISVAPKDGSSATISCRKQ